MCSGGHGLCPHDVVLPSCKLVCQLQPSARSPFPAHTVDLVPRAADPQGLGPAHSLQVPRAREFLPAPFPAPFLSHVSGQIWDRLAMALVTSRGPPDGYLVVVEYGVCVHILPRGHVEPQFPHEQHLVGKCHGGPWKRGGNGHRAYPSRLQRLSPEENTPSLHDPWPGKPVSFFSQAPDSSSSSSVGLRQKCPWAPTPTPTAMRRGSGLPLSPCLPGVSPLHV